MTEGKTMIYAVATDEAEHYRNRAERAEQECEELRKCLLISDTAADDYKREADILQRMLQRAWKRNAELEQRGFM
jgi:hypothetical protein